MKNNIASLFDKKELFEKALTHRSWLNENKGVRESNERLEFLGDAVLQLIVSEAIFDKFKDKSEGYLSELRANLVNTQNLANIAKKLDLGSMLHLSKGEENSGGRNNISLLADTLEAVVGGLYIDQGYSACEEFIQNHVLSDVSNKISKPLKSPKTLLQEYVQEKGFRPPRYKVVKSYGPSHAKMFTVEVKVDAKVLAEAHGTSKAIASTKAAKKALLRISTK